MTKLLDSNFGWEGLLAQFGFTVSAAVLAAWAMFRFLGRKWIDSRFAKDLERYRHEQIAEVERLKFRISTLVDRTVKLHQNEYEVLPQAWERLGIAFAAVRAFTDPLQSYPDLERMTEPQFASFLERSPLLQWQQDQLRETAKRERNQTFQSMIFFHRLQAAGDSHNEFHNYLIARGVFIQPALKEQFRAMSDLLWDALIERKVNRELDDDGDSPMKDRYAASMRLRDEGPRLHRAIEDAVQKRLWDTDKLD